MSAADSDKPDAGLPAFKPRDPLALSMPQREAVIERLTQSFAEDAITMDEFERRAELAYRVVSMADLQALVSDLPGPPENTASVTGTQGKKGRQDSRVGAGDRITTMWSSTERGMPGVMPRFFRIRTFMGNTELDFRQSTFEPGVTEVNVRCMMGNVELTVPEGVRVELVCSSVLGNVGMTGKAGDDFADDAAFSQSTRELIASDVNLIDAESAKAMQRIAGANLPAERTTSGERVLRITGRVLLGNVEVHRGSLRREP